MCTALTLNNGDFYFGRTLDLEYNYSEEVVVTPRDFPFVFRNGETVENHGGFIGIATVIDNYPLYYEAVNERGLCVASLNFAGNAVYFEQKKNFHNIASFEFIPWVLSHFDTVEEVSGALRNVNITNESFSKEFSATPLHWIISDKNCSITVESVSDGLKLYDNPVGVLTNSPDFSWHMTNLSNYMNLTSAVPENNFASQIQISPYSKGLGAFGLPGDGSSSSRFIRAAFTKFNSIGGNSENENISRFFHIMDAVSHTKGCIKLDDEKTFYTIYTSCYNANKGICYYTTYENRAVTAVSMYKENIDSKELIRYLITKEICIKYL